MTSVMATRTDRRATRTSEVSACLAGAADPWDPDRLAVRLAEELGLAIDPRKLKPIELVRLLNSTPLGEVTSARSLYQHRARAGMRIGDDKTVDLLRYTAWLAWERHHRDAYDAHRERARQRQAEQSRSGRDVGELPAVVNPERRARCERNLRAFYEEYFPQTFYLPWSPDHLKVIAKLEAAILEGGLFALAMPRGGGKTSMIEAACLWALGYGHRRFVPIIGPDEGHAVDRIRNLRTELETNDRLAEDFPEICYPIRCLEGINQRRLLYQGRPIVMDFTAKRIVLPDIPDSRAAGAVVTTAGITGQVRGLNYKRRDGVTVRPDFVILDDPQTDESAHSPSQCDYRERVINGAILGLAGPGVRISAIMPCTVIRPDDLADRILDRERNPHWQGERTKLVYSFPTNEALWKKYEELRREDLARDDRKLTTATALYAANREAMDAGAVVAWPERHNADELSAVQHVMNLRYERGEVAFWAEYQNEPLPENPLSEDLLTADEIAAKVNGHRKGEVPLTVTHLTMFIDVQAKVLFWLVVAWEDDFTGYVIDYGTEPDQKAAYFTLRDVRHTLAVAAPRAGLEGSIRAGLVRLCGRMLGREWKREDGSAARIERCLIDANWGQSTDVVYEFCRQSDHASVLTPSHGKYVGASSIPFAEYKRKRGDRVGLNWRIPHTSGRRAIRHVVYDTNYWKSFIQARFRTAQGDPGCLTLFGRQPEHHRLLGEHLTSEYPVRTEGRGRTVDEWKLRASGLENHWLDCLVGSAVAASMQGAVLFGTQDMGRPRPAGRRKLSELQRGRR
jgi:hypothetical protein